MKRPAPNAVASDRLMVLQLVRLVGAAAILVVPLVVGDAHVELVPLALAYALVTGAVELMRRRAPERMATLLSGTVLVDGLVVALAIAITGGYTSPLRFLVFLDVMAVTVLISYRTGIKLAIWCALLLLLAHSAAEADLVQYQAAVSDRVALVTAATFLLFVFAAAIFSSVNERALRHSRAQLETLVQLGTELERAHRFDEVMEVLVHHSCARLGFARAAVLVRRGDRWHGVVDDGETVTLLETSDGPVPLVWEAWERGAPLLVRTLDDDLLDAVLPGARERDRRARHGRRRDHRCRGRGVGRVRGREHARTHRAGVRAVGDAHRARVCATLRSSTRSSASRRATASPVSRTVDCSRSRSTARPRGRGGSARRSAC